ncbi:MAG: energy-coupling factor transporter transmembrane protein EcfT, partial [Chloroflexi bacterium]|nr:energy-coupling factor transporter transmembrane protein EcfT [Chloroflexota bacterium]
QRRATAAVMVGGLLGMCAGMYALLDGSAPPGVVLGGLVAGGSLLAAGIALAGRWTRRTRHRPDRWLAAEWMVLATGIGCVALVSVGARLDPASMVAAISPLAWPQLPVLPAAGILLASLPAMLAPMPPLRAMAAPEGRAAPASAPLEAG